MIDLNMCQMCNYYIVHTYTNGVEWHHCLMVFHDTKDMTKTLMYQKERLKTSLNKDFVVPDDCPYLLEHTIQKVNIK